MRMCVYIYIYTHTYIHNFYTRQSQSPGSASLYLIVFLVVLFVSIYNNIVYYVNIMYDYYYHY